ncbi:hypothetical protein [Phycicoccus duodecadis]|uniref:AAA domain-containing protein n=1 Tax=Phycicoccus duodecadis TaxID=173053 RepID=A0A2N3YFU0_9MICO|nr:hypothetical protein [Phycicoccus duodecadis]PKW25727.1 hypothetical protein ATL31_0526 [Phycicoccus duodecadis]
MTIHFTAPVATPTSAAHHAAAAIRNVEVTSSAVGALQSALDGSEPYERLLLKAAAGAGKSYALRRLVREAISHPGVSRVGVTAFANKQVFPLALELAKELGRDKVCLMVAPDRVADLPPNAQQVCAIAVKYQEVPDEAQVVVGTTHKLEGSARWMLNLHGPAANGSRLFDVLFVDEAWQLPLHRYRRIDRLAPVVVGVGDVGQLPPLDSSQNPWRGDGRYNPYRAWPTAYDEDAATWAAEMPAVWRPTAEQLGLWRAFYAEWDSLDCVAAPGDRGLDLESAGEWAQGMDVWRQVATGVPTLVEVAGLADAEAPDVDLPLMNVLRDLLDELLTAGFATRQEQYDAHGAPAGAPFISSPDAPGSDPLIAVLATRNQAVDDAQDIVDELVTKYDLPEGVIVASTVDSWQGQTNGITVAIHPLSGASTLDEFNSAFGRLAVTCTRATHGLLLLAREGLDDLLSVAPARPGTPLGEPGSRQLPRQTHQRILATFSRGVLRRDEENA